MKEPLKKINMIEKENSESDLIKEQSKKEEIGLGIFSLSQKEKGLLGYMNVLNLGSDGETIRRDRIESTIELVLKALNDIPKQAESELEWLNEVKEGWDDGEEIFDKFAKKFNLGTNEMAIRPGLIAGISPWYEKYDRDQEGLTIDNATVEEWQESCRVYIEVVKEIKSNITKVCNRIINSKNKDFIFYEEGRFDTKEHELLHRLFDSNRGLWNKVWGNAEELYNKNSEAREILTNIYTFHEHIKWEEFVVNTYIANRYGREKTSYGWQADKLPEEIIEEIHSVIINYLEKGDKELVEINA